MTTYQGFYHVEKAKELGVDINSILSPHAFSSSKLARAGYAHLFSFSDQGEQVKKYENDSAYRKVVVSGN